MHPAKIISVSGARTRYLDLGYGDAVVLVHDIPGDARTWRYSVDALASRMRVLALDLPGWGGSDVPKRFPYTLEAVSDHIAAFLVALGIERTALAGLGFGALAAAETALRHPERVARLALSGAPLEASDAPLRLTPPTSLLARQWYKRGAKGRVQRLLRRGYVERRNLSPELLDGYVRALKRARTMTGVANANASLRARLPSLPSALAGLGTPLLLLWGELDALAPVEQARRLEAALPQAALRLVPHAGHYAHEEMPAPFNGALLEFLKPR